MHYPFVRITHGLVFVFAGILTVAVSCSSPKESTDVKPADVEFWLTTGDRKSLLQKTAISFLDPRVADTINVIAVDPSQTFQQMDGFGYSLTGGSAMLLHTKLDAGEREQILTELFTTEGRGIGVSYLRISIGASDLDDHVFSYVDLKPGQVDKELKGFTLEEDQKHLIPVLKEILVLNPSIKIMGSPWSAPAWMKTNEHPKGGSLKPEFYKAYANYLVRYLQSMAKEGIVLDAITLQNEPENPNNTPSMLMTAAEQVEFVKTHLGPAFRNADLKMKIVVFDHNCDHPEYPIAVLNNKDAKPFIDGSAFHLYLGDIEALSIVRDAHPDKNIYFTEQWTSGEGDFGGDLNWHTKNLIIGASRNWAKNVLEWNLAADPNFDPHTDDGGCTICLGALTIGETITRNVSYYIIAHASKFVPTGSVRISSNTFEGVPNVAFLTPEGRRVLIALNETSVEETFIVTSGAQSFRASLPPNGVGSFIW